MYEFTWGSCCKLESYKEIKLWLLGDIERIISNVLNDSWQKIKIKPEQVMWKADTKKKGYEIGGNWGSEAGHMRMDG